MVVFRTQKTSSSVKLVAILSYPRHSMYAIYVPTLGWFEGSMGRHIWQSHGVSGYYNVKFFALLKELGQRTKAFPGDHIQSAKWSNRPSGLEK